MSINIIKPESVNYFMKMAIAAMEKDVISFMKIEP